jgi:hypothetical protein
VSQRNNWDVTYPDITFIEDVLKTHQRVTSYQRTKDIVFTIQRTPGLAPITAVLVKRYTISLADVIKVQAEFPELTCIVTPGDWARYTREAKEHGLAQGLGVFNSSEFFGALWKELPHEHVRRNAKGEPTFAYRSA